METGCSRALWAIRGMLLATAFCWTHAGAADKEQECESTLSQGEVAVARARSREALWTTAVGALRDARRLRRERQWDACVEAAREAQRLSELGLGQLEYPPERD